MEGAPCLSYEQQVENAIAKPMANKKLAKKKLYKLINKAAEHKTIIRFGVKDVQVNIREGETGLVIFAGDVTPIDVFSHMPGVCGEKNIDYIYTPSKDDLGHAMGVKRNCVMVLVKEHPDYKDLYDECKSRMRINTNSELIN
ncbi:hypothetical protein NPIL_478281 [Nephila pilipes]|uniref:Ribosomal protein eL8/eL30/eS12/Gadd45 domain-containing protein n=1 Tax=Nephila pilipes TaxID=299642 RepID=A0A8X6TRB4_NEPPI|nr:hypothetical protein NPIL_478281 [Nephila pilipes]